MPAPKDRPPAPRRPITPGQKFGKLTVLRKATKPYIYRLRGEWVITGRRWLCRCECGREVFVCTSYLNAGMKKRCGLGLCRANGSGLFTGINWRRNKRTYSSWSAMKDRCLNPLVENYADYGGRGITICERWLGPEGFQNFLADMDYRPPGKTLDRINPNGNYEPGNCRWATAKVQANNQRRHWAARMARELTPEEQAASVELWRDKLNDPELSDPAF